MRRSAHRVRPLSDARVLTASEAGSLSLPASFFVRILSGQTGLTLFALLALVGCLPEELSLPLLFRTSNAFVPLFVALRLLLGLLPDDIGRIPKTRRVLVHCTRSLPSMPITQSRTQKVLYSPETGS